jgi:hypothetical protein
MMGYVFCFWFLKRVKLMGQNIIAFYIEILIQYTPLIFW